MSVRSNSTAADPVIPMRVSPQQRDLFDDAARTLSISRSELLRRGAALMVQEAEKVKSLKVDAAWEEGWRIEEQGQPRVGSHAGL